MEFPPYFVGIAVPHLMEFAQYFVGSAVPHCNDILGRADMTWLPIWRFWSILYHKNIPNGRPQSRRGDKCGSKPNLMRRAIFCTVSIWMKYDYWLGCNRHVHVFFLRHWGDTHSSPPWSLPHGLFLLPPILRPLRSYHKRNPNPVLGYQTMSEEI